MICSFHLSSQRTSSHNGRFLALIANLWGFRGKVIDIQVLGWIVFCKGWGAQRLDDNLAIGLNNELVSSFGRRCWIVNRKRKFLKQGVVWHNGTCYEMPEKKKVVACMPKSVGKRGYGDEPSVFVEV